RGQLADAGNGEHRMSERDEQAAHDHRAMRTKHAVGDEAACDREQIDAAGVPAEEVVAGLLRPAAAGIAGAGGMHQVQREQRAHPVVAGALPHLHDEDEEQARRVAEEAACFHFFSGVPAFAGTTTYLACMRSSTSSASIGMLAQRSSVPPLRTTTSFSRRTP